MAKKTLFLKDLPKEERPRHRLLTHGGQALSDTELLSILIQTGRNGNSSIEVAGEVLAATGGLAGLGSVSQGVSGIGRAKQASILAAVELGTRIARSRLPRRDLLDRPDSVASYLTTRFYRSDQETMGALYLDVRNRLIKESDVFRGTLSRAAVEPRHLLKEGLLCNASGLILFHTHPSGDPSPSTEDLTFTRRVAEAGELLGVKLLDHLILGSAGRWVSLGRRGAW